MAEYIEREALLKQLDMALDCKDCPRCVDMKTYYDRCAYSDIQDVCGVISDMPVADVQPVKYSSWEYCTYPIVGRDGVARSCMRGYVCKACGHGEPEEKRFCGGCGADMQIK